MLTPFEQRAQMSLRKNSLFEALGSAKLRWVRRTALRRGETLFDKGALSSHLYGLVSGQIKLISYSPDGRVFSLGIVAPGELLGELGIADGLPHHARAVALTHCEIAALRRQDLEPLMDRYPEIRVALTRASTEAARRLAQRLEDEAFLSIEMRVEKTLLDLAARIGKRIEHGTRIGLRQQDLADVLGLSRESVNKVLTSPYMRDKLELGRGSIVLVGV